MTNAALCGQRARVAVVLVLLAGPMANAIGAQERPGPAVDFAVGWVGFPDEGVVSEGLVGGAARWYLLPRVSVGPELVYLNGSNHSHFVLTGNVTWDLLAPAKDGPRRGTPFLAAGGGLFQTREHFFNGPYTSSEGAFTAGGGVRAFLARGVTLGFEVRAGWEPHIRINGLIGLQLGR